MSLNWCVGSLLFPTDQLTICHHATHLFNLDMIRRRRDRKKTHQMRALVQGLNW